MIVGRVSKEQVGALLSDLHGAGFPSAAAAGQTAKGLVRISIDAAMCDDDAHRICSGMVRLWKYLHKTNQKES